MSDLFVLTADGGTLEPGDEPDQFTLTLEEVPARLTVFSERPARLERKESTSTFEADWKANGFADDPPNAALVIDKAPASRDVGVFELANPRYDAESETLRFDAVQIDQASGRLRRYALDADDSLRPKFGRASLFIDSAPATYALLSWILVGGTTATITTTNAKWTFSAAQPRSSCATEPNNLVLPTAISETSFSAAPQDEDPTSVGCALWAIYLCSSTPNTTTLEGTATGFTQTDDAFGIDASDLVQNGTFSLPLEGDIYQPDC